MLGNFIRTKDQGALVRIVGHSFGPEIWYPMYIKSQVCDRVHLEVMVFQVNISQPSTSVVSWHIFWHSWASRKIRRLQKVSFMMSLCKKTTQNCPQKGTKKHF